MVGEVNILNLNPFGLFLERSSLDALYEKAEAMVDEAGVYEVKPGEPWSAAHQRIKREARFSNSDQVPVLLERGTFILTPEQAEAVGLTADARRMRREQGCECETCKPDPKDYEE